MMSSRLYEPITRLTTVSYKPDSKGELYGTRQTMESAHVKSLPIYYTILIGKMMNHETFLIFHYFCVNNENSNAH